MRIDDEMELLLESRELAEDDVPTSGETLSDDAFRQSVRLEDCYSADNASRLKRKMIEFAQNSSLVDDVSVVDCCFIGRVLILARFGAV